MNTEKKEYLLGVNEPELERLRFQYNVWKRVTDGFFERLNLKLPDSEGWKCLDAGAGPGLVTADILGRVGAKGEVTAVEPSGFYLDVLRKECAQRGWYNVKFAENTVEGHELPLNYFNFIFARWVIAFVPSPELFLKKLVSSLAPGGIIAIQDYAYEGLSLFPRGGACDGIPDVVRKYYRSNGGDPYIAAKLPGMLRKAGLRLTDYTPTCLAGGPSSGVFEWAYRFFDLHIPKMAELGLITKETGEEMLQDWNEHRRNPDSVFFSPIVVDVAGVKE